MGEGLSVLRGCVVTGKVGGSPAVATPLRKVHVRKQGIGEMDR